METMVVYSSMTGNTQKIATAIFSAIPCETKDMQRAGEYNGKDAELFFVGFWTDKGCCDTDTANLISGLHGKKVALFGTCGMGADDIYYRDIEERVKKWLPADNEYMGAFLCQGKMPMQVRKRYESMIAAGEKTGQAQLLIRNFDEALLHPDRYDLDNAAEYAKKVYATVQ